MADPYCTIAEADVFLALDFDNWIVLTDDEKNDALYWGRVYIDAEYTCLDSAGAEYDDTTAPDELKRANAEAANASSKGQLFESEKDVSETTVTAGSVSSTKKYAIPSSSNVDVPELSKIRMLLQDLCSGTLGSLTRV